MIGKRLKELRMKRGFSQQELGTAIGVTKVSICGYENGTRLPTLDNLVKISEVLETTADYLLGREVPVMNEENKTYIGAISYEDVQLILALRHYPNIYNKLLKDVNRYDKVFITDISVNKEVADKLNNISDKVVLFCAPRYHRIYKIHQIRGTH